MRSSRVVIFAFAVALASIACAIAWVRLRHETERRFANLSVCLLGDDPLRPGELPSQRLLAIDLARPPERMMTSPDRRLLVPEKPIPAGARWPNRCAVYADEAARGAARLFAPLTRDKLAYIAAHLANNGVEAAVDALWVDAAPILSKRAADPSVDRPWRPVELVASPPSANVAPACRAQQIITGDDEYAIDDVFVKGAPGCVVSSTQHKGLTTVKLLGAGDHPTPATSSGRDGKHLSIGVLDTHRDGRIRFAPMSAGPAEGGGLDLGATGNLSLCNGGDTYALVVERGRPDAPDELELRILDATGATGAAHIAVAEPIFAGRSVETKTSHSRPTVSCRGSEAHIAWAFSNAIDQRPTHEVFVASCTRSKNGVAPACAVRSQRVHAETGSTGGCSMCVPKADPYEVGAPWVVDLFGATALVWVAGDSARARVAPLEKLDATPDTALWYAPRGPNGRFALSDVGLLTRADVTLVAIDADTETRLFRIDTGGVYPLLTGP